MKIVIDTNTRSLSYESHERSNTIPLYSREAFELLSKEWVKVGWSQKYSYSFSWMGRPIIQLPEDMIRIQELIFRIQPEVILETGVAHGGSLIYYASLCKVMGKGRVIGIDIEIRPHNREAIEAHMLSHYIQLIEGDSISPGVITLLKSKIRQGENVLLILDSCHHKQHVRKELEAYQDFIQVGGYAVVCDGIMRDLSDVPGGKLEWVWNHPADAAREFVSEHPEFTIEEPVWLFNQSNLRESVTHWPGAFLRRAF